MRNYRKIVGETFKQLGTVSQEWKPCEIIGFVEHRSGIDNLWETPIYEIAELKNQGYKIIETRFPIRYTQASKTGDPRDAEEWTNCTLCDHSIKCENICYIKHEKKKWIMQVGSTCVWNYDMAKIVAEKRKVFIKEAVEKAFKKFVKRVETARQAHQKKKKWMPRWLWDAGHKLDTDHCDTVRKQKNYIKKYKPEIDDAEIESSWRAYIYGC